MENLMLELGRSAVREDFRARIDKVASLDAAFDAAVDACGNEKGAALNFLRLSKDRKGDRSPSPHVIYVHEEQTARSILAVMGEIREGRAVPCDTASLRALHHEVFSPADHAGMFSEVDNGLRYPGACTEDGLFYHAAPACDKVKELDWTFETYRQALEADPDLALAYAFCLSMHLIKIHPFEDGNGRTARLLLVSEMRRIGLEHAADIPLEWYCDRYYTLVCARIDRADEGYYRRTVDCRPYVRLMFDLVEACYKNVLSCRP